MSLDKVVVKASEFRGGAPMEVRSGVRDWKAIYPETGVPTQTLILGIVEIDPGQHSPMHRHNCEEIYYVLQGKGEIEANEKRHTFEAGDAIFNRPNILHQVFNASETEPVRLVVVGGIMFVGLLPEWPTPSPYEIFDEEDTS